MRYTVQLHERILSIADTESGSPLAPKNAFRGTIKGISSKSRYRLIKKLAKINRPDEPIFITLTYRSFTDCFVDWKTHLDNWRRRISASFPEYAGVWRLEFQKRGAPHYHVLLWLGKEVPLADFQRRCTEIWCRCIGQTDAANFEYGCTVEPVTDFRQSAFYLSVYQAKDAQDRTDIHTGREWGLWHRKRLRLAPVRSASITGPQLRLFRRLVRRQYESFMRSSGKGLRDRTGATRGYLRGLRRDQPFSCFMPFAAAYKLVEFVRIACPDTNPF